MSSFLHIHTKQKHSFFFFLHYATERELDLKKTPTHATMPTQYWPGEKNGTLWIISFTSYTRNFTLPKKTLETPVSRTEQVQPLLAFQTWWDHSWRTHAWSSYFLLQHHVECYQFYQHIPWIQKSVLIASGNVIKTRHWIIINICFQVNPLIFP